ncbi:hypothetical protein [Avibacterium sp. 20-129]|uniref:hypothetical protein n=1 Tax=Avibacterium sp. 20-129 TaxID=2911525 RepID=UPI0022463B9C|nr:hypothetical protein [Avibacterium sp. 20-129]MCW9698279.1 hypothetical protein [Avibacterium sp. 20-129]
MVAMVMRKLRKNHQSEAGKALKVIVKTLKSSHKAEFYRQLHYWYLARQAFLNERSEKANERVYFPYKHQHIRGAYASLKRYEKYLFPYEKYLELNIEKTTNRIEGLFSELKRKLNNHNRLTKKNVALYLYRFFLNKKIRK